MFSRLLLLFRVILMTAGVLLLTVTFTPLVQWTSRCLSTGWTDKDQGVLIVLSGATVTYDDPPGLVIGQNTYWRVIHAIAVWRHGHFRHILLSGTGSAETIKPLLITNGIPESAILVENGANNTHENALFTKPILAGLPGPYVLLTSDYHMYRASRCFAHEKIAVETLPAPDFSKGIEQPLRRWDKFLLLAGEFASIGYYHLHGWI